MSDSEKTKEQLIEELAEMRSQIAELKASEASFSDTIGTLNQQASFYRSVVDVSNEAIFIVQDRLVKFANRATREFTGHFEIDRSNVDAITTLVHPDDQDMVLQFHSQRLSGDATPYRYDVRIVHKDGTVKWGGMHTSLINWEGRPAALCLMTDISERKRADEELQQYRDNLEELIAQRTAELEHANLNLVKEMAERTLIEEDLRESERRYRLLVDNAPVGIILANNNGDILEVNRSLVDILGSPGPEATKTINLLTFQPLVAAGISDFVRNCIANRKRFSIELPYTSMWGKQTILKIIAIPNINQKGEIEGYQAVVEDVTLTKETETALREAEIRYRHLSSMMRLMCDNIPDLIWAVDLDGKAIFVNKAVCEKLLGVSDTEEPIGKTMAYFAEKMRSENPQDSSYFTFGHLCENSDATVLGTMKPGRFEEFGNVKGQFLHLDVYKAPFFNEDGVLIGTVGCGRVVTAERRVEAEKRKISEALRASEEAVRTILSASPVAIGFTQNRVIKWVNEAWINMFGFAKEEECIGQSARIIYRSDEEFQTVGVALYSGLHEGRVTETDVTFQRIDGSTFFGHMRMKAIDPSDLSKGAIAAIADISDRKSMEELLRESEEKYRILVERALEGICVAQDGYIRFANPAASNILGHDIQTISGKPFTQFIHVDDRELVSESHARRLKGEQFASRYSFRVLTKDGSVRWVEIDSGLISWEGYPAALFFINDITERTRMEQELRRSEEWYRSLVENCFDGVFVQQGLKIIFANSRLYQMLGYSPGELEGKEHWLVYHPDYHDITRERAKARLRGEEATPQYEVKLQSKDGSSFPGEISARPVQVYGEPGVQVWLRDISQRKKSEETQRRLATVVQQATDGIVIMDNDWKALYVNSAFERMTGFRADEVIGCSLRILDSEEPHGASEDEVKDLLARGLNWTGRLAKRRADGARYHEDLTIWPVRDDTGHIANYVGIKRDVTQEVGLQQQLLHAQKMEAVGTLAGGIAHDFNNLLQVVIGYSQFLLSRKEQNSPEFASLQKIISAAKRGGNLVKGLLTFSRKAATTPCRLNLNDQINEVRTLLDRTIPKLIKIQLDLQDELPDIFADPTQIQQVLMNLSLNAMDAMPDGGLLTIETKAVVLDQEFCRNHEGSSPGIYAMLVVSDTGHGMSQEILDHVFEPFYSTKDVGKGTGLGLAMVYGIVKQHDGDITCESEPGKGSTFRMYFPLTGSNQAPPEVDQDVDFPGGCETILLVEDEEVVRELCSDFLHELGYTVLTAVHGRDAIKIYQQYKTSVSLVILDLNMPEMGGKECFKELLKIDSGVRVVIASGYSSTGWEDSLLKRVKDFVEKPYDLMKLARTIRIVLAAAQEK